MLLHTDTLLPRLANKTLLLDTSALIKASHNKQFLDFLKRLSNLRIKANLVIIPSVYAEFTKKAKTQKEYKELEDYLAAIGVRVFTTAESAVVYDQAFNMKLHKECPNASYTDALLCKILYMFRKKRLILVTGDHDDMPYFFTRVHALTLNYFEKTGSRDKEKFRTIGFYVFSDKKYKK